MTVWAIIYSNYEPNEVHSLWATKDLAEQHIPDDDGDWRIIAWTVGTE